MEFITITNNPDLAQYFESCGIQDIMVDLEILGKKERQKGLNTVISAHNLDDIDAVKAKLTKSNCLVRINPIYNESEREIEEVIRRKADIIMLPMFKTAEEVEIFIRTVNKRTIKYLLLETAQALVRVDEIISLNGIDAIHIGLNDLSISMGLDFLYEPLIGGIVEYLAEKFNKKHIKFGFGGVSRLEKGRLILSEHYRLGSSMVIINRDFRNYKETYKEIVNEIDVKKEIKKINNYMKSLKRYSDRELEQNRLDLFDEIKNQIKNTKPY